MKETGGENPDNQQMSQAMHLHANVRPSSESDHGGASLDMRMSYDVSQTPEGHYQVDFATIGEVANKENPDLRTPVNTHVRVVLSETGEVIDNGGLAPTAPFMEFRAPFDETYVAPPIEEQQAAGRLLGDMNEALFGVLPPSPGSGIAQGYEAAEKYTDDARISVSRTAPDSAMRRSGQNAGTLFRDVIGAPQVIGIAEHAADGDGATSLYVTDKDGAARRWDTHGVNNETARENFTQILRMKLAEAQGPAAVEALKQELETEALPKLYPRFAAQQGVNYLPVSEGEVRSLAQVIGEKLDLEGQMEQFIQEPTDNPEADA